MEISMIKKAVSLSGEKKTPMKSYVDFELEEKKPKTAVYRVVSKSEGTILGRIFWRWAWRQYVFELSWLLNSQKSERRFSRF